MIVLTARRLLFSLSSLIAFAPGVNAQDTLPPLVFLHGFANNAYSWTIAENWLGYAGYQTAAFNRNTTSSTISAQAAVTSAQLSGLPSSFHHPIMIGHSMGGLVARQASKLTPATAILTVGSPHKGHPALHPSTSASYWYLLATLSADVTAVIDNLNHCGQYRNDDWEGPCYTVWEFAWSVAAFREAVELAQEFFFPGPAVDDIRPGSSFLNTFNDAAHVSQETGLERIAVSALLAPSEQFASVWRAIGLDHDQATDWALAAAVLGLGTVVMGWEIMDGDDIWSDPWYSERMLGGLAVVNTGVFIIGMSEWWNGIVGGWPNDGFMPAWTQVFPGAADRYMYGYAHLEEPSASELITIIDELGQRRKR